MLQLAFSDDSGLGWPVGRCLGARGRILVLVNGSPGRLYGRILSQGDLF